MCLYIGLWDGGSTLPPSNPTLIPTSTIKLADKTRLPTSHGMFVPMNSFSTEDEQLPPESLAERNIAIISAVFTGLTLLAFVVAMLGLFRDQIIATLKSMAM